MDSDELPIFETETLQQFIEFKWGAFAWGLHFFGCIIHLAYIAILFLYTYIVYVQGDQSEESDISIILLGGVAYPALYEFIQMCKNGPIDYFTDFGNWIDIIYIYGSVLMSQLHSAPDMGPYHYLSKLLMISVVILAIRRTFNFLRIFRELSPIVTMLTNVIYDLRIFMTFYILLTLLFSLIYGVIGLGNYNQPGDFRNTFYQVPEDSGLTER